MKEKVNPLTLSIEKEAWEKFKLITPRTITLNDAVVNLIKKEVEENE